MAKRSLCMLLAIVTLFSLAAPAFAEEAPVEEPVVTEEPVVEATEEPVVEVTEEPAVEATEEPVVEVTEEPAVAATEEPEATEAPEPVEEPDEPAEEPMPAAESGSCGAGVTYTLTDDGVLTISGKGPMTNYDINNSAPWAEDYSISYSIDEVVIGSGVTSIGEYAFYDCGSLTGITIPDSVTSIGDDAFCYCTGLTSMTIPDSVTSIGEHAFFYCTGLTSVTIPDRVTSIGDNAFYFCSSLTSIKIPASVTSIGSFAFSCCWSLTSVTIPDGVTNIGEWAFSGCTGLTSVTIPDSVTGIEDDMFNGCSALKSVTIPKGVASIGGGAFFGCSSLTSVTIPEGVTSIGGSAFSYCEALTSIKIPSSVTSIGQAAFAYSTSLGSITILNPTCAIEEQDPEYPTFSNATIKGYTGSTAEAYAKQYGYKFEALDGAPAVPAKLATPKITKMENTASGLKVTWGKVPGAVRYTVFYKLKGASKWTKIGTTTATSYTRKAKDLKSGKTYVFTIRCVKNDKKTYTSDYDKAGKSLTYYAAPTVKIAKASNGGIKVTWNKITGSPRYMVYYRENGGSWKRIGTTTAASYTCAASKLKNGVTYQFTVRCVKNDKKTLLSSYKASNSLKYKK